MALGCRLTSVRGNRGEKNTKNEPLVHQKHTKKKKCYNPVDTMVRKQILRHISEIVKGFCIRI
jgi:hypothetical protein